VGGQKGNLVRESAKQKADRKFRACASKPRDRHQQPGTLLSGTRGMKKVCHARRSACHQRRLWRNSAKCCPLLIRPC